MSIRKIVCRHLKEMHQNANDVSLCRDGDYRWYFVFALFSYVCCYLQWKCISCKIINKTINVIKD